MPPSKQSPSTSWWVEAAKTEALFYAAVRAEQDRLRNSILPLPLQKLFDAQLKAEADSLLAGCEEVEYGEAEGDE